VKKAKFAADTMALILRLESRKMGSKAKASFISVEKAEADLIIPAMVLVELCYLSEKKRIESNLKDFKNYRNKYESITVEPMTEELIEKAFEFDDTVGYEQKRFFILIVGFRISTQPTSLKSAIGTRYPVL
jgi:predicted nucleic acid-binding protein